jgi:hypothetical protein
MEHVRRLGGDQEGLACAHVVLKPVEDRNFQRQMLIRDIIDRMRHDGCGGRAGRVELLTGIEGVGSRAGAADRAGGRRRAADWGSAARMVVVPRDRRGFIPARWAVPTIVWRRAGCRDWDRSSQTGALRSAGLGDLPMTVRILPPPQHDAAYGVVSGLSGGATDRSHLGGDAVHAVSGGDSRPPLVTL